MKARIALGSCSDLAQARVSADQCSLAASNNPVRQLLSTLSPRIRQFPARQEQIRQRLRDQDILPLADTALSDIIAALPDTWDLVRRQGSICSRSAVTGGIAKNQQESSRYDDEKIRDPEVTAVLRVRCYRYSRHAKVYRV